MIILGTLRVHPHWSPGDDYYGPESSLSPRDTAEGQLWLEENALERAEADRPVSVIRALTFKEYQFLAPWQWHTTQMG